MRKHFVPALLAAVLAVLAFAIPALAAEDLVFTFDSAEHFQGWSVQYIRTNDSNFKSGYFVGYAQQKGSTAGLSDPGFTSPTLNIQAEDYRYLVADIAYQMDAQWGNTMTCFFLCEGQSELDQAHSSGVGGLPVPNQYGFTKVVIDMSKNPLWTGTIKKIRFDPFEMPGTISLKSLTFTNTLPEEEKKEEEVKPEDDKKEDETPKKEVGVFERPRTYANNFTDVPADEWYAAEVAKAYELGLINGETDTIFAPNDNMTIAEALTIAARTRNAYGTADYDFTLKTGDEWYQPYLDYCVSNSIIAADTFAEYDRPATRGEMAYIFSRALPAAEYAAVNSVANIPDVPQSYKYFAAVKTLYNAGIVMGNDGYGTFSPDNNIIRAEAAAIINRVCNKDARLKKNLDTVHETNTKPFAMSSEAKFLIENFAFYNTQTGGVPSGWDSRTTLTTVRKDGVMPYILNDDSPEQEAYFYRKINETKDGVLDFEIGALIYSFNGAYIEFTNDKREPVVSLKLNMGSYQNLGPDGTYTDTGARYASSTAHIRMIMNMDDRTYDLGLDGAYIGTFPMASADKSISALYFGVAKEAWMSISANYVFLRHNMLTLERFVNAPNNILPFDVKTIHDGGVVTKEIYDNGNGHGGTAVLNANANGRTGIAKKFAASDGKIIFESYILLPEVVDGAKIALKNGDADVFYITTAGGNFLAPNGEKIKYVTKNLWHIIRFEADTATGKALVRINGKTVGTYDFAANPGTIDGYEITYTPASAAKMYADEIMAFVDYPFDDYVPEPVRPEGDEDYLIGMNVCSLWRNGVRHGSWDMIAQYPEIEPLLGYYDEGSPEVADWEIKFMSEHGIDYQMFCWYPADDVNKPIFRTSHSYALIDGYMNARYSDKMNFAIMWENTAVDCKSMQAWQDYMVPYIIEYFFKDPRYQLINNKPLFGVWSSDALGKAFGDVHYKEAFKYLENKAIEAGFAGVEFMIYNAGISKLDNETGKALKENGFDSIGVYHFGSSGAKVDKQLASIDTLNAVTTIDTMLAVSVGFDDVGWGYGTVRNGLLDPKDYPTVAAHVKELLAKRDKSNPYSKMVMISTWNEYGEGTYVSPTKRYGFGYLDAVRAAFTKGGEHTDVLPTAAQKKRINYLFDQDRGWIAQQNLIEKEEVDPYAGAVSVSSYKFDNAAEAAAWRDYGGQINWQFDEANKKIIWTTTSKDPCAMRVFETAIDTEAVNGIRIRAKINTAQTGGGVEVFFSNGGSDSSKYTQAKSGSAKIVPNEWTNYVIDFRKNKEWASIGKINAIRFDPCPYAPDSVEVESIEFIKLPDLVEVIPYKVDINGKELGFAMEPDTSNGGLMCTVNPQTGVPVSLRAKEAFGMLYRMKCDYTWDKNKQIMTIWNNQHSITFTIGEKTAVADGKSIDLYAVPYMYDGIPVLPLDILVEKLGYALIIHEDGHGASIMLGNASDYDIISNRKPGEWEFNLEGDAEDWTSQNLSSTEVGTEGFLHGVASGRDPAISSPALSIDAAMYESITVRIRYEHDNPKKDNMTIYFKTTSGGLAESRTVRVADIPNSTNGEFVEYTFPMSEHLQWVGTITGIRFDPFNALGNFDVDYIRFNTVPGAEEALAMKEQFNAGLSDVILNGDAEVTGFVPADGTNVSIVKGDLGHVYNVKQQGPYNYFWYSMKFIPGQKYHIEFDAKMIDPPKEGASTTIFVNLACNAGGKLVNTFKDVGTIRAGEGMQHYTIDLTVPAGCDNKSDKFGIYTNPVEGVGVSFQLDNLSMERVD